MINLYTITVPQFIKHLGGLKNILTKAEAYAKEKGMSEEAFLNDAIIADMFPLKRQVQLASDHAKGAAARLSGKENPKMEDIEATFAELQTRIDKTIAFLETFKEEDFKDAPIRQVMLPYFPGKYLTGEDFAVQYAVPNFFFHATTAYDLVRKNGVQIGKGDYMNDLPFHDVQ